MANSINLDDYYVGVSHVHSRYSHDGRHTLRELADRFKRDRIDFCVVTEHFEDLDRKKFTAYLDDVTKINARQETLFIPGVETEFRSFHILWFPVVSHDEIKAWISSDSLPEDGLFTVLAHPAKNALSDAADLIRSCKPGGVELWNQQADGNFLPPASYMLDLKEKLPSGLPVLFFGVDLHDARHRINNFLLIEKAGALSSGRVVDDLRHGRFLNYNASSPRGIPGASQGSEIETWLDDCRKASGIKSGIRAAFKKILTVSYHLLPRFARIRINALKNTVKNKL